MRIFLHRSVTPIRIEGNIQLFDFELSPEDMEAIANMNLGYRHLLWPECSEHPDYPFKDDLPFGFVVPPVGADASCGVPE